MVVELHDIDFPEYSVLGSVLNGDREITTVVEASEFRGDNRAAVNGTSNGSLNDRFGNRFQKGSSFSTKALTFLKGRFSVGSNALLSVSDKGDGFAVA